MTDLISALGIVPDERPTDLRVVTAVITQASPDVAVCTLADGTTATLPVSEYYPERTFRVGDRFSALVIGSSPRPLLSVVRPEIIEALYAGVAPEVRTGAVRVMGVSRAPGVRAKVAVAATEGHEGVDPVASCVGRGANRVRWVSEHLGGERIDVVAWHPDPEVFLRNALAPAQVGTITIDGRDAKCHTPAHQMSAAVGGGGLNSVLAGQLVGLMVEIVTATA